MPTTPDNRCLIYAHWDINGFVDPYVLHALREYRSLAGRIIFVTTHYQRPCTALDDLADTVIVRDNSGYDFMSWRTGLETIDVADYEEVVFTNSSIYGPLWPMAAVFESPTARENDLWGMTTSLQHCRHLQSYFLCMSRHLLTSDFGRTLWKDIWPMKRKEDVIEAYELAWMNECLAAGFKVGALFDARQHPTVPAAEQRANIRRWPMIDRRSRRYRRGVGSPPYNPTHLQWKQLLECGVPFVKVDLLRNNPMHLDTDRILQWLETNTAYPVDGIRRHLSRMRRQGYAA
jgi:lipopolysaccharide biosynthesis protein